MARGFVGCTHRLRAPRHAGGGGLATERWDPWGIPDREGPLASARATMRSFGPLRRWVRNRSRARPLLVGVAALRAAARRCFGAVSAQCGRSKQGVRLRALYRRRPGTNSRPRAGVRRKNCGPPADAPLGPAWQLAPPSAAGRPENGGRRCGRSARGSSGARCAPTIPTFPSDSERFRIPGRLKRPGI